MAGCGAYSGDEDPIDVAKFKQMAFRINWKLSDDFPYMGMFIPPVTNADERWERSCDEKAPPDKPRWTSCRRLNDYARYMKTNGFYVLDYFNVTEFGKNMGGAPVRKPGDPELWQDPRAFLKYELPGAVLIPRRRHLLSCQRGGLRRSGLSEIYSEAGAAAHPVDSRFVRHLH